MKNYLFVVSDFLSGKPVYPVISRILHVLFSASIASFLFEKFYFHYHWLEISDYKGILDFFIKGYFVVPFTIYVVVHFSINLFSTALFSLLTFFKSATLLNRIHKFQLTKEESNAAIDKLNNNPVVEPPEKWTEPAFFKLYEHIKSNVPAAQWNRMEADLDKQKINVQKNFHLGIKTIIVVTIYFVTISYFGWMLYLVFLIVILLTLLGLWVSYLFLDLFPAAIRKFRYETDKYILESRAQNQ